MRNTELKAIIKEVAAVLKHYPVAKAAIFGSFARGEENKQSDIDILIQPSSPVTLFQVLRMEKELKNVTKRKIDVVEYSAIKKSIRANVLKDAIPVL